MARISVAQLRVNMSLRKAPFLLREKSTLMTRTGSPMLRVVLADRTGAMNGVMFDVGAHIPDSLVVGGGVEVTGRVSEYREQTQITLDRITPVEITDPSEYLPVASRDLDEMEMELDALIAGVEQPDLARLLAAVFDDPAIRKAFVEAPAAKTNHHACMGGLMEHSLAVARLVVTATGLYPELDSDLALTAALLHDIGKIRAYDRLSFAMTPEGALWGHLSVGAAMVQQIIDGMEGFDPDLRLRLIHIILSHHGKRDAGSPVVPMTLEAIVVHHADHLDGDAQGAIDLYARAQSEGETFTDFSFMHDTRLFKGNGDTHPGGSGVAQGSLW